MLIGFIGEGLHRQREVVDLPFLYFQGLIFAALISTEAACFGKETLLLEQVWTFIAFSFAKSLNFEILKTSEIRPAFTNSWPGFEICLILSLGSILRVGRSISFSASVPVTLSCSRLAFFIADSPGSGNWRWTLREATGSRSSSLRFLRPLWRNDHLRPLGGGCPLYYPQLNSTLTCPDPAMM